VDRITNNRVVITGIGPISSVGTGKDKFWQGIVSGRSGVKRIERIPLDQQPASKIAAEISDFDPLQYLEVKQAKRTDRFIQFAVAASRLAVADAKLDLAKEDPFRVGVVVGSAAGGFQAIEDQFRVLLEKGPDRCSPMTVPMLIVNMAAGWVSMIHNAKGPNLCSVTACATSAHSIGDGYRIIQRGEADVIFAGGSEAPITSLVLAGFSSARTLSTRNDEPTKASRPFDLNRDGFVLGEGAAILILESLSHAQNRGAHIYAEIVGYGSTSDAYDIVQPRPDGEGAGRAMSSTLEEANLKPEAVDYVNAHGTSTPVGDRAETTALKRVFKDYAQSGRLAISSTKSMTGHLLGAAGALEAAISILAIQDSIIPATINLDTPDPQCDLNYTPNKARLGVPVNVAMSNSFGFGGHNCSLLFRKFTA
jgi:3-oxoacyl-[acyl-carrier-protein] synthase II